MTRRVNFGTAPELAAKTTLRTESESEIDLMSLNVVHEMLQTGLSDRPLGLFERLYS